MRTALRRLAEWAALMLLGSGLGVGAARAIRAGLISERTFLVSICVLMGGAAATMIWSVRGLCLDPWDDEWDD